MPPPWPSHPPVVMRTFAVAAFAMITHCGYRLSVYHAVFAPAAGHDLHHSNRTPTNISVVLSICDRLFGTHQPATQSGSRSPALVTKKASSASSPSGSMSAAMRPIGSVPPSGWGKSVENA
jgi:sterol desaturase/sphingolipid hydroxylase (fatty acid hydroxylase superfamily)